MSGNGDQIPEQVSEVTSGAAGSAPPKSEQSLVTLGDMQSSSGLFAKNGAHVGSTVALNTVTIEAGNPDQHVDQRKAGLCANGTRSTSACAAIQEVKEALAVPVTVVPDTTAPYTVAPDKAARDTTAPVLALFRSDRVATSPVDLNTARTSLAEIGKATELSPGFQTDMQTFEARAQKAGLTPEEIAKTYTAVTAILDGTHPQAVNESQRKILALQILHNAAYPVRAQGNHNTCIESEFEMRLYTRQPSAVAGMLQQVAASGKYSPPDGSSSVQLDAVSLNPHGEAKENPPGDGKRGYASQLFQVTAINLGYSQMNDQAAKNGISTRIRYEQHEPQKDTTTLQGDTGERLVEYFGGLKGGHARIVAYEPGLNDDQILDISKRITGNPNEAPFILNRRLQGGELKTERNNEKVLLFDTPEEMTELLAKLKTDNNLPAIIGVNTGNQPFYSEVGVSGPHSIGVLDSSADRDGNVLLSTVNSWGEKTLHLGDDAIPADEVFAATFDPLEKGSHDVLQAINDKKPNPEEEAELLWLKLGSDGYGKKPSQSAFATDLQQTLQRITSQWHADGKPVDATEVKAVVETLSSPVQFFEDPDDQNSHALDSVRRFLKQQFLTQGDKKVDVWTLLQQDISQVPDDTPGKAFFSKDPK